MVLGNSLGKKSDSMEERLKKGIQTIILFSFVLILGILGFNELNNYILLPIPIPLGIIVVGCGIFGIIFSLLSIFRKGSYKDRIAFQHMDFGTKKQWLIILIFIILIIIIVIYGVFFMPGYKIV